MRKSRSAFQSANIPNPAVDSRMQNSGLSRDPNASGIFDIVPSSSESSLSLKIALIATVILIIIELILMFHKHHFYNILVYCLVLAVFFLNYFDSTYVKFLLVNILLSILLDLVWLIVMTTVILSINLALLVSCS